MASSVATMSEPKKPQSAFTTVKLNREVAKRCKAAAALDGKDLSEWLADVALPVAERRIARHVAKQEDHDE